MTDHRRGIRGGGQAIVAVACAVTVLGLVTAGAVAAQEMRFFRIGTATTGGTYFPVGALIANAVSGPPGAAPCNRGGSCGVPGLIAIAQATAGSVQNLALLRDGALEAALAQANLARFAYDGTGVYRGTAPFHELCALAALYPEQVHLVVRADSGIRRFADLAGKRVSVGEPGSGSVVDGQTLFAAHGLDATDLVISYDRPGPASDRLADGRLDAMFVIGGAPFMAIADLAERAAIALVPPEADVLRGLATSPVYTETVIPAGTYTGIGTTPTLGVSALLVVRRDLDDGLAFALSRALWHDANRDLFRDGREAAGQITLATALDGLSVPLHPGARRYYAEIGLLDPADDPARVRRQIDVKIAPPLSAVVERDLGPPG